MWIPKNILAISAHADDIELGAGGTVHKLSQYGSTVYSFVFSTLKNKVIRMPEIYKASKEMGIKHDNVVVLDYPNREFNKYRQDILQNLIDLSKDIEPDVVFTHTTQDRHQDHEVMVAESIRAFKSTCILGFEAPWNMTEAILPMTSKITEQDLDAKIKAVLSHETECYRHYINESFVRSLATVRGQSIGGQYGESFEVIRWVM